MIINVTNIPKLQIGKELIHYSEWLLRFQQGNISSVSKIVSEDKNSKRTQDDNANFDLISTI